MIKFHYNRAQLSEKTINILSQDKVIYIYNEGGTRKGAMVIDRGNILVEIQGFSAMILTLNCMSSNQFKKNLYIQIFELIFYNC